MVDGVIVGKKYLIWISDNSKVVWIVVHGGAFLGSEIFSAVVVVSRVIVDGHDTASTQ